FLCGEDATKLGHRIKATKEHTVHSGHNGDYARRGAHHRGAHCAARLSPIMGTRRGARLPCAHLVTEKTPVGRRWARSSMSNPFAMSYTEIKPIEKIGWSWSPVRLKRWKLFAPLTAGLLAGGFFGVFAILDGWQERLVVGLGVGLFVGLLFAIPL